MNDAKAQLLRWIDEDREEIGRLGRRLVAR
jgi:hypothetical protein